MAGCHRVSKEHDLFCSMVTANFQTERERDFNMLFGKCLFLNELTSELQHPFCTGW